MAYFAKFTERGQRALLTAQREAAQLGRTYVGTEHLLLGVLSDPGAASVVLKGITLDAARQEIIQILGRGDDDSPVRTMVYTPRTKKVLEQSVREARELKQNYVGTEHILLALMREREGVAAHVMIKMGMDLSKAREELLRALSGGDFGLAHTENVVPVDAPGLNRRELGEGIIQRQPFLLRIHILLRGHGAAEYIVLKAGGAIQRAFGISALLALVAVAQAASHREGGGDLV